MHDHIDIAITRIAQSYARDMVAAGAAHLDNSMAAGSKAQNNLASAIRSEGATRIQLEPRTGVDSAGGGQSRYDALFNLFATDIYMEVQASDYHHGHKPVQLQGQVLGFAEVAAGAGGPARYYKIIGRPRLIYRWSRRAAQCSVSMGDYDPQIVMLY
jgi:hypothetical protein